MRRGEHEGMASHVRCAKIWYVANVCVEFPIYISYDRPSRRELVITASRRVVRAHAQNKSEK